MSGVSISTDEGDLGSLHGSGMQEQGLGTYPQTRDKTHPHQPLYSIIVLDSHGVKKVENLVGQVGYVISLDKGKQLIAMWYISERWISSLRNTALKFQDVQ